MNLALWKKAFSDIRLPLLAAGVLLASFGWLFVWLMSYFDVGAWSTLLNLMPSFMQPLVGVPLAKLATPAGQISILSSCHVAYMCRLGDRFRLGFHKRGN